MTDIQEILHDLPLGIKIMTLCMYWIIALYILGLVGMRGKKKNTANKDEEG